MLGLAQSHKLAKPGQGDSLVLALARLRIRTRISESQSQQLRPQPRSHDYVEYLARKCSLNQLVVLAHRRYILASQMSTFFSWWCHVFIPADLLCDLICLPISELQVCIPLAK